MASSWPFLKREKASVKIKNAQSNLPKTGLFVQTIPDMEQLSA